MFVKSNSDTGIKSLDAKYIASIHNTAPHIAR